VAGKWLKNSSIFGRENISLFSEKSILDMEPTQQHFHWAPLPTSPGVKWRRRETDLSKPCSAEVTEAPSYASIYPIWSHGTHRYRFQQW